MLAHERAAELERVLAGRPRHFVHEAFHVDGVLVGVDAAPRADRHVRVAHRVLDEQVRHGVAELRVAGLFGVALELAIVLAVRRSPPGSTKALIDWPDTRTCSPTSVALVVEAGGQLALRDRPVEVVRHVLFAAPDHLDRHAGELLGDGDGLAHVVLRAAAPAEAAAEVVPVDLALRPAAMPDCLGQRGQRGLRRSASAPSTSARSAEIVHGAVHRLHGGVGEERRAVDRLDLLRPRPRSPSARRRRCGSA